MIGFKVSPLLWKRIYIPHERVERGAVPDPALKLIYDNYVESQLRADGSTRSSGSFLV
jgi:hypothetical protein